MTTKIQKWGNSFAIRIPKQIIENLGLSEKAEVDFVETNNSVIIKPKNVAKRGKYKYTLSELLSQIDPDDLPERVDFGPDVGIEILPPYITDEDEK